MPDLSNYPESVRAALLDAVRRDPASISNSPFRDFEFTHGPYTRTETISFARDASSARGSPACEPDSYIQEIDITKYHVEIDTREIDRLPAKERRRLEKFAQAWIKKRWG